ncbi:sodium:solute symporter [Desertivirga arenae]|uniref:sodium:solute symporter n=1 Tax=Desertivirga arenae TaxID=2810309 RepID=UPI001A9683C5|nr:sodium:solute symporter [Pedobacter sp. SYSU D00823]
MSTLDWLVLGATLLLIVIYGIYKSRGSKNLDSYFLGGQSLPWYHVGLSVMATQASAITFLSAPGQAYSDGMRFVQFYFGLPLAMIVLCITFVPIFHKLRVFTAYEFLEQRFDLKTRVFTAFLFLIQRGLSTGISIYAPALILSEILHLNPTYTTLFMGGLVIVYTVYGGTKAVSYTQLLQMSVIFSGLFIAGVVVVYLLPDSVGLGKSLHIAGSMGRMNVIDWKFDWENRYNVWSGIIGGFFLQLSYFGTDQSQVGRYLTGSSVNQSRLGLIMNALIKIPMQFLILLIGVLVFTFYQYHRPPIFFNSYEVNRIYQSPYSKEFKALETQYKVAFEQRRKLVSAFDKDITNTSLNAQVKVADLQMKAVRDEALKLMEKNSSLANTNDTNYVFLTFVTQYLPKGLVGLLIAIIFLASMGSIASAFNSLASTTSIDIYKRLINPNAHELQYYRFSRACTVLWGLLSIAMALYAGKMGNLIEAVNILGSLFYGTILGIFIVAFYFKNIRGKAVFYAAILTEVLVCLAYYFEVMAYLWLNVLGCVLVIVIGWILEKLQKPGT